MCLKMMTLSEFLWNKVTSEDSNFNFCNLSCFAKSHITPPALPKISVKLLLARHFPIDFRG